MPEVRVPNLGSALRNSVTVRFDESNALRAIVRIVTGSPARVMVSAQNPKQQLTLPVSENASCDHDIVLAGLRPGTEYLIMARAVTETGTFPIGRPVQFRTGFLPRDFPVIESRFDASRMAPGLTLLSLTPSHPPAAPPTRHSSPFRREQDGHPGHLLPRCRIPA